MNDHVGIEFAPLVRTDFSDDDAWQAICAEVRAGTAEDREAYEMMREFNDIVGQDSGPDEDLPPCVNFIDDRRNANISTETVLERLSKDTIGACAYIVDQQTITNVAHPILVVDLHQERGRSFRATPSQVYGIENTIDCQHGLGGLRKSGE
jgi:hypothetical protein